MKRLLLVIFCITSLTFQASAQEYSTGVGVKLGGTTGFSLKHFLLDQEAVELIVGERWRGTQIIVLYEIHEYAFDVPGLYWYYGGGGHIGFWDGRRDAPWDRDRGTFVGIGLDGVLGVEYDIETIPITVSLDVIPAFNIGGYTGIWVDGGIAIRYIF